ncbi:MAG: DUF2948 family protein [Ancalomicrobiaceae bacterium]|nr:DUF2948 family protein [Ancalomicrobiaceae bacterium]
MALDGDDLAVLSSYVQDAVVKAGEIRWLKREKRLILALNRFVWEAADAGSGPFERRRAALHFDRVVSVQSKGVALSNADAVLELLAVLFEPGEDPSGTVEFAFAGGATLRASVECVEAQLTDLGAAWATVAKPEHKA